MSDGLIEVVALDNFDLAVLQMGCHAKSVCQCKKVVITTSKVIHMKVDGEPVLMKPCTITITLDPKKAPPGNMLQNKKSYNGRFVGRSYGPGRFVSRSSSRVDDVEVDQAARTIQRSWRSHRTQSPKNT